MRILDRYIARQFLFNIVLLHLVLFSFVVVIDFSLNFDEFIDLAQRTPTADGSPPTALRTALLAGALAFDLWWPRLFQLFNYMLGLMLVGGMGFTCSQLAKRREFVAMLAGGQSLMRIARPIFIVAIALTALQAANREFVVPQLAELLTRTKDEAGQRSLASGARMFTADASGRLFYAKSFDLQRGTIDGLWVWERDADGLLTRRITATSARWSNEEWILTDGRAEKRLSEGRTPGNRFEDVSTITTDLSPTVLKLRRYDGYRQNLSTRQATELIDQYQAQADPPQRRIEELNRIRFGRIASMLSNIVSLLLSLPFFLQREPRNMIVQSLLCAPVAILAQVGGVLGSELVIPGVPAAISVFIPVMILTPPAIAMISSVKT